MKKLTMILAICALGILCRAVVLPAQEAESPLLSLTGEWRGVIVVRPAEFEVDVFMDLRKTPEGTVSGSLSYPNQGPKFYPLDTVSRDGDIVQITSTDEQGVVSIFQGRIDGPATTLRGELTEGGRTAPFEMRRIHEGKSLERSELKTLSASGEELKAQFNADVLQARLLMILSPTCSFCRMGARLLERHLLEISDRDSLSVYVVWEPINAQDSPESATDAASLLTDSRIHQYWSPNRFASSAFRSSIGLKRGTAFDVYLVFGRGKIWKEAPPAFEAFMHNQRENPELPKDRILNADRMVEEVRGILVRPLPAASE